MPYYKDMAGGVHFIDSADYESLLPAGCTPITDTEATELLAPEPEPLDALRDRALELLPTWEKSERAAGIEHAGQRWLRAGLTGGADRRPAAGGECCNRGP